MARNARRLGLNFPHLVDPDFEYWKALGNRYWPTVYLVDRCGRIRASRVGEIHTGEPGGREVESVLQKLLAEVDTCGS